MLCNCRGVLRCVDGYIVEVLANLRLKLGSDIARSSGIVCGRAWAYQVQHLPYAHSDFLRQAVPNCGIFGNSIVYRMESHDGLARDSALSSLGL